MSKIFVRFKFDESMVSVYFSKRLLLFMNFIVIVRWLVVWVVVRWWSLSCTRW